VVVGAARNDGETLFLQAFGQRAGVGDNLVGIGLEFGTQRFAERNRLGGDDVDERAALKPGRPPS
jgi:hypothetical protein